MSNPKGCCVIYVGVAEVDLVPKLSNANEVFSPQLAQMLTLLWAQLLCRLSFSYEFATSRPSESAVNLSRRWVSRSSTSSRRLN